MNYVDHFDRFGIYNRSDPNVMGASDRDDPNNKSFDTAGKRLKKNQK